MDKKISNYSKRLKYIINKINKIIDLYISINYKYKLLIKIINLKKMALLYNDGEKKSYIHNRNIKYYL